MIDIFYKIKSFEMSTVKATCVFSCHVLLFKIPSIFSTYELFAIQSDEDASAQRQTS